MEYTWYQFTQLDKIRKLPLNEQVRQYNFHLQDISEQIMNQNKGIGKFLLQESGFLLLQENGQRLEY